MVRYGLIRPAAEGGHARKKGSTLYRRATRVVETFLGLLRQTRLVYRRHGASSASFSSVKTLPLHSITTPGWADHTRGKVPRLAWQIVGRIKVDVPSFPDISLPHLYTLATTIHQGNQPKGTSVLWSSSRRPKRLLPTHACRLPCAMHQLCLLSQAPSLCLPASV